MDFDIKTWLKDLKIQLSIQDEYRDDILTEYLNISREAIWTQYYELNLPIDETHIWASDSKTKMATLHLGITLFSNPDINLQAKDVRDDRMIYRILSNRVNYGGYITHEKPTYKP